MYEFGYTYCGIEELVGKTLTSVVNIDNEELVFTTTEGDVYKLLHVQDCCETVYMRDITGDLQDLVGSEILLAEEVSSDHTPAGYDEEYYDSFTWTFYKLATLKGYVDLSWLGTSNGYYSEGVDFIKMDRVQ